VPASARGPASRFAPQRKIKAVKYDAWLRDGLDNAAQDARVSEQLQFDGAWNGESNADAFLPMVLAAEHSRNLEIGSAIALAFARNPMTVAYQAIDLQRYSRGRFVLGLGTQVRAHIERRFSMPWSRPAARMRDFVSALHAIWDSWERTEPLQYEGQFYRHTLMTPNFVPPTHPYQRPKVFLAAVGTEMLRVAAEVADGLFVHPFCTERYLTEVVLPCVETYRPPNRPALEIALSPLVVLDESEIPAARRRIAFYCSTLAYLPVLEKHGWEDLQLELNTLVRRNQWDAMANLVGDELVDALCCAGDEKTVASELLRRYGGRVHRMRFYHPGGVADPAKSAGLLAALRDLGGSS
jgi:probable F420-dependent oxidoreductase